MPAVLSEAAYEDREREQEQQPDQQERAGQESAGGVLGEPDLQMGDLR